MTPAEAIEQFTTHIRKFSDMVVVDTADINAPTPEQTAAQKAKVESLCDELDVLAKGAPTLAEFEAVRQQLYAINAVAPLGHLRAVHDAIFANAAFPDFLRAAFFDEAERRGNEPVIAEHLKKLAASVSDEWDEGLLHTFELNVSRDTVIDAIKNVVPGWPDDAVTFLKNIFTHAIVKRRI